MSLYDVIADLDELNNKRLHKNQEKLRVEDELFGIDEDIYLLKSNIFNHFCKKEIEYNINPKSEPIPKMGNITSFIYEDSFTDSDGEFLYNCLVKRDGGKRFQVEIVHPRHMVDLFMKTNKYSELYRDSLIGKLIEDDK